MSLTIYTPKVPKYLDRRIVERSRHSFTISWGGTPNTFLNALVKLEGW